VVYLLVLLFPNSYTILFWEFYLLPFSVYVESNVIYVALNFCLSFFTFNEIKCEVSWSQWLQWFESAEPQRTVISVEYSWNSTLDVGVISKRVLPAQLPVLFWKVWTPSIPWEQHLWYVPYRDLAGYNT
jgi:hypothetical protein